MSSIAARTHPVYVYLSSVKLVCESEASASHAVGPWGDCSDGQPG